MCRTALRLLLDYESEAVHATLCMLCSAMPVQGKVYVVLEAASVKE